ncbi:MAG: DUF2335 domain-containing protein [Defluviitaleaceae bacterium]|nr:DUF2335 domain-containing protein [Defluviitaleaceae bacterium]
MAKKQAKELENPPKSESQTRLPDGQVSVDSHLSARAEVPTIQNRTAQNDLTGVEIRGISTFGPLPEANQFSIYEKSFPGAADRILTMAEEHSKTRQTLEVTELNANIELNKTINATNLTLNKWGIISRTIISLAPIVASVILAFSGFELAAGVIGVGSAGVIISFTVAGIKAQNKS